MPDDNILVTGAPRSGTTLTCHLLNKLPDTVALHEPMRVRDLAGVEGARGSCRAVQQFCDDQRHSILTTRRAVSKNVDGAVPDNPFGASRSAAGLRQSMASKSEITIDKELTPTFGLVVKHNSAFAAVLDELVGCFPVFAIVRNPLATISSWSSVDFNGQSGHAGAAERLSPELKARLEAIDDTLDRQIYLLGWFHERFRRVLPERAIVRYESIVETGGRALAPVRPTAAALAEPLDNRNANKLYDQRAMARIGERLLASDGGHWALYERRDVERLMNEIAASAR